MKKLLNALGVVGVMALVCSCAAPVVEEQKAAQAPAAEAEPGAPRSGEMIANTCAGCHGTDGHSAGGNMPSLAGLNKRYLYNSMKEYQSGVRPSTIMGRIAKGYSDYELQALVTYFASQPWEQAGSKTDAALVKAGKALTELHCETCHKDGGRSQYRDVPRLAGQWAEYLNDQLTDMSGDFYRGSQPAKMLERVRELTPDEIKTISHFYASQE